MKKLFLLVPVLLLALSGCATKGGATFSEASAQPGKSLVYVYRHDAVAGEWMPTVRIAGTPNFDLPNQTYAALNLAPGKHVVEATWLRRSDLAKPRSGPLIVEEYDATCVVPPGAKAELDAAGNIVIELG